MTATAASQSSSNSETCTMRAIQGANMIIAKKYLVIIIMNGQNVCCATRSVDCDGLCECVFFVHYIFSFWPSNFISYFVGPNEHLLGENRNAANSRSYKFRCVGILRLFRFWWCLLDVSFILDDMYHHFNTNIGV